MSDRTAFFGETLEAARYRFGDTSTDGGNYIVAEDLDGERVLLQFDYDADEWQYAGDVDMGGGDLNSVGTARVDALEADISRISQLVGGLRRSGSSDDQIIESGTETRTKVGLDSILFEDDEIVDCDPAEHTITIKEPGAYILFGSIQWQDGDWSTGDLSNVEIRINGNFGARTKVDKISQNVEERWTTTIKELSSGDVLTLEAQQDSGSDKEIGSNPTTSLRVGRF